MERLGVTEIDIVVTSNMESTETTDVTLDVHEGEEKLT